jgi:hypothetical protein
LKNESVRCWISAGPDHGALALINVAASCR